MIFRFRKELLLLALPCRIFAGLSLSLTPGAVATFPDPVRTQQQPWRIEFQMHDWSYPAVDSLATKVFELGGTGAAASLLAGQMRVFLGPDGSQCILPLSDRTNILVRIQRDPAKRHLTCEEWNYDSTGYASSGDELPHPAATQFGGGGFGSPQTTAQLGFFRVFDTLLPEGSRPPTTAIAGNLLNFSFDGTTQDTSGSSRNLTLAGAVFRATPNQIAISNPKTDGAPAWSNWTSLRAGFPATLDGTASFSLADGTDTVNYRWQQISGPTTVRWSDRSSARPVIRGLIFGTYRFRLQVTDAAGKVGTADLDVGAVATDDNGIVVQANPAADILFGPMIAFGKNPWPWMDQIALRSATIRRPYLDAISPPAWAVDQPGRISYEPARLGQPAETTLALPAQASDTTLTVADASRFDLSVLPAVLSIYTPNSYVNIEDIRVCSVAGNVLSVCYDGRAWRAGMYLRVPGPQQWQVGSVVRQFKTKGTGTNFLSVFCPAGPGEPGLIVPTTGTVNVTPGSAVLSGSSGTWNTTLTSYRVRIEGTHGGQPFVFFANVNSVNSGSSITMSRPWPSSADSGTISYAVIRPIRTIARGWRRPDGSTGRQATDVSACISDTDIYLTDVFSSISGTQTDQTWGYMDSTWISDFGPNYYDEVLAHYADYLRSGYTFFRDNARKVGDFLPKEPNLDEGWMGGSPRRLSVTGLVAGAVLDGRTQNWYVIRKLATRAVTEPFVGAIRPGCDGDLRETAYSLSWLALAAIFDPVDTGDPLQPNQRSYWKTQLSAAYQRDLACKGPHSEFPTGFWRDAATTGLTLTKGSTSVRGTNIPQSLCSDAASGTINVTNGSNGATGGGFVQNAKINISATRNGAPYLFMSEFTVNSANSLTLASPYDGDSGSFSFQIDKDTNWLAFAKDGSDHANTDVLYACRWTDSSNIVLDRPWHTDTGTYQGARGNLIGYGQQPFLAGIKVFAMKLASLGATGEAATGYSNLANDTARWILDTGFDPDTGGLHYARGLTGCEPKLNPRLGCTFATTVFGKQESRTLNGEAQNAIRVAYQANPTAEAKAFGDKFYGSQWGKLGGPSYDDVYLSALDYDGTWSYKWLGFLFGIGMAHQWPAVRLGGLSTPDLRSPSVAFNMAATPGAVTARVTVTQPSGATAVYACPSSPCSIGVDARQGGHWYRIAYLDSRGSVIASQSPELLELR